MRDTPAASLGYGDPRGRPELRALLADYLARVRGVVADPEQIVLCGGFRHGLSLVRARSGARGAAGSRWRSPASTTITAHVAAGSTRSPARGRHGARTDLLDESGASAALLGPAHQFPRGAVLHPERRASAVAWARASGGLLVEDDYDAELRFDRPPIGALQALDPECVAYGGTVSKTLAPGLRLGWLVLPPALLDPVMALRDAEDLHVPAPDQIAFAELLRSGAYERHVRRMRARYRARRDRLVAMLAERAPRLTPVGISAGLRVLSSCRRTARPPASSPNAPRGARSSCFRWAPSIITVPGSRRRGAGLRKPPRARIRGRIERPRRPARGGVSALSPQLR